MNEYWGDQGWDGEIKLVDGTEDMAGYASLVPTTTQIGSNRTTDNTMGGDELYPLVVALHGGRGSGIDALATWLHAAMDWPHGTFVIVLLPKSETERRYLS